MKLRIKNDALRNTVYFVVGVGAIIGAFLKPAIVVYLITKLF